MKLILILILLFLTGCTSGVYVNDGIIRTEDGSSIIDERTKGLTTQNIWEACTHNSYGDDCYIVRKFGESSNVGTTVLPVSNGNVYQMPKVLTTLQIVSTDVDDTFLGDGARTVEITGLSTNFERITEIVELDGTTPVILNNQFFRVYRMKVDTSGNYAGQLTQSHQGDLKLTGTVGGELWAQITVNGVALGQTEIAAFTIPKGYHGHLGSVFMHNNGNKAGNVYMFVRNNASNVIVPYDSMRVQFQIHGLTGGQILLPKSIGGAIPETSDLWYVANTDTGTTEISVNYEILLVKNE